MTAPQQMQMKAAQRSQFQQVFEEGLPEYRFTWSSESKAILERGGNEACPGCDSLPGCSGKVMLQLTVEGGIATVEDCNPANHSCHKASEEYATTASEIAMVQSRVGQLAIKANAACDESSAAAGGDDVVSQLEKLTKLRDAGALSEEEFATAKAKVLSGSPLPSEVRIVFEVSDQQRVITFQECPLGFVYEVKLPALPVVEEVKPGSVAEQLGVSPGMVMKSVGGQSLASLDRDAVTKLLKEATSRLPKTPDLF